MDTAFWHWAHLVLHEAYRPCHEYRWVGCLPGFVLHDPDVVLLGPQGNGIFISDYQLRHALRGHKRQRHAALPLEVAASLPEYLQGSRWAFDAVHRGLLAFFDTDVEDRIGKAVVHFGHIRRGVRYNAVLTAGLVRPENENEREYRSLKPSL